MTFTLNTKSLVENQQTPKIATSSAIKGPTLSVVDKGQFARELSDQTFELSPIDGTINHKDVQQQIDNNLASLENTAGLIQGESQTGAFEAMFGDVLAVSNPYGDGMNRYGSAMDIMDMAESHSAKNRVGAASSARMNGNAPLVSSNNGSNKTSNNQPDDYKFELDEDGNVIGWDCDENGDPIEETRENQGAAEEVDVETTDPVTGDSTSKTTSSESNACPNSLLTVVGVIAAAAGDAGAKSLVATGNPYVGAVGAVGGAVAAGIAIYFSSDAIDDICKNPNPMDDNYGYEPGTPLDPKIERIFTINPDRDPVDEGSTESGPYTGPSLGKMIDSHGGISTGTWEQDGGEYMGPSLEAVKVSMAGTSTGSDWF